jgi:hypothetical protein
VLMFDAGGLFPPLCMVYLVFLSRLKLFDFGFQLLWSGNWVSCPRRWNSGALVLGEVNNIVILASLVRIYVLFALNLTPGTCAEIKSDTIQATPSLIFLGYCIA